MDGYFFDMKNFPIKVDCVISSLLMVNLLVDALFMRYNNCVINEIELNSNHHMTNGWQIQLYVLRVSGEANTI